MQQWAVFASGRRHTDALVEEDSLLDGVILEGSHRFNFIFYMAVRRRTRSQPMVVLFPVRAACSLHGLTLNQQRSPIAH